ncbi:hypothetical protein BDV06DRAFT_218338 [Aspergillus oleicola]
MCIPVAPEHKALRGRAIKSMKAVYERAFRVLVLDGDIQSFSSTDYTQAFMRIRMFSDGFLDVQGRSDAQQKETYRNELLHVKRSFGNPMRDTDNFQWKFRLLRINVISEPDPRIVKRTEQSITSPEAKRCFAIMEAFSAALYRSITPARDAVLRRAKNAPARLAMGYQPVGNCGAKRLNVKSDDITPGLVTEDGFVVEYPALVLPSSFVSEQLDHVTVSVELGDGVVGTFEIKRHDQELIHGTRDHDESSEAYEHGQLYVLSWDP